MRWSHETREDGEAAQFHGDPLVAGDLIVTGSDAEPVANLYAFERRTGGLSWKKTVSGGVPVDVLERGSRGYTVGMSGEVFSFDIATGRTIWSFDGPKAVRPGFPLAAALVGDRLAYAARSGDVYALDVETGRVLWKRALGEELNTSLLRVDAHLVVGASSGRLYRLDPGTGSVVATLETGGMTYGTLVAGRGCLVVLWMPGTVACVEPTLKRIRWKQTAAKGFSAFRPLVLDTVVVTGTEDGNVIAYRLEDGKEAWRIPLPGVIRGLGAGGGVLYVGTLKGTVWALPLPSTASVR